MKKVLIWTDCNKEIGAGHFKRCTVLANKLLHHEFEIQFVMVVGKNSTSFPCHNVFHEDEIFTKFLGYDYLIIDTYSLNESHLSRARKTFKHIIVIDDLNNLDYYNVDLVINGDYQAKNWKYSCSGKALLGTDYLLIGPEFAPDYKDSRKHILILTGATNDVLVERLQDLIFNKLGPYNFIGLPFVFPNLSRYKTKEPIHELMQSAALVVTAGGMSIYESLACGAPVIGYIIAENQRPTVESLAADGLITYATTLEEIPTLIDSHPTLNLPTYKAPKVTFDNQGAERIVNEIKELR